MSGRERRRLEMFSQVKTGRISVSEASRRLGLSERQARRLWRRYLEVGDGGLTHGLRGRAGNAGKKRLRERALALYRRKYAGLGAAHAAELMAMHRLCASLWRIWNWIISPSFIQEPSGIPCPSTSPRFPWRRCWKAGRDCFPRRETAYSRTLHQFIRRGTCQPCGMIGLGNTFAYILVLNSTGIHVRMQWDIRISLDS